ncbi:MAG: hypothetical protein HOW73_31035 [Polyangiaceae bacterium]|nr:hypothetical protein [Polyangiaceae bacterium]
MQRGARNRRYAANILAGCSLVAFTCGLAACAEILGVGSEFEDIVGAFCKCEQFDNRWPNDLTGDSFYPCDDYVRARLDARPELVADWVSLFDEQGCASCQKAEACANAPPICIEQGDECITDTSCCGFDEAFPTKAYCGITDPDDPTARCTGDENFETCARGGEACEKNEDCCGATGFIAGCSPELGGRCIVLCDEVNDASCPDCCATAYLVDGTPVGVCPDSIPFTEPPACENLCEDSCPFNFACTATPFQLSEPAGAYIDVNACVGF